jgi:hypothetical protein
VPESDRIRTFFAGWVAANGNRGPVGEIAQCLADGKLEPASYYDIVARHGVAREQWARDGLIDLVLNYSRDRFAGGLPSIEEAIEIKQLRATLHIGDEALIERRPVEISRLLLPVFDAVLADGEIDDAEDRFLIELQAAFGLSYDQFLMFARPSLEHAVDALRTVCEQADLGPRAPATLKLKALDPIYRLAVHQRGSLGALRRPARWPDTPPITDLPAHSSARWDGLEEQV